MSTVVPHTVPVVRKDMSKVVAKVVPPSRPILVDPAQLKRVLEQKAKALSQPEVGLRSLSQVVNSQLSPERLERLEKIKASKTEPTSETMMRASVNVSRPWIWFGYPNDIFYASIPREYADQQVTWYNSGQVIRPLSVPIPTQDGNRMKYVFSFPFGTDLHVSFTTPDYTSDVSYRYYDEDYYFEYSIFMYDNASWPATNNMVIVAPFYKSSPVLTYSFDEGTTFQSSSLVRDTRMGLVTYYVVSFPQERFNEEIYIDMWITGQYADYDSFTPSQEFYIVDSVSTYQYINRIYCRAPATLQLERRRTNYQATLPTMQVRIINGATKISCSGSDSFDNEPAAIQIAQGDSINFNGFVNQGNNGTFIITSVTNSQEFYISNPNAVDEGDPPEYPTNATYILTKQFEPYSTYIYGPFVDPNEIMDGPGRKAIYEFDNNPNYVYEYRITPLVGPQALVGNTYTFTSWD